MRIKNIISCAICTTFLGMSSFKLDAATPDLGDPSCDSLLLVSGWNNNNVKIFDGCSGKFIRDLDSQNLISGPLGILQAPNKDVLVISERNARMIKFDFQTLSEGSVVMGDDPVTTTVEDNFINKPISAVIDESGNIYAASFGDNNVVKIDSSNWTITDEILPPNNGRVRGIDVGLALYDGQLYIPGWNSHNVIKVDVATKQVTNVVASSQSGLFQTRAVLVYDDHLLVSGEGNGAIMSFDTSGSFIENIHQVTGPTGMQKDGDDHFIAAIPTGVLRIANDGSSVATLVQPGAGNLDGATFVYRLYKSNGDKDNDGLMDEDEVNIHKTDPENPDTDGDTLTDGEEVLTLLTNPLKSDSDDDGMPDAYEVEHQLNPNLDDANADKDQDGLKNLQEYQAQTNPNNPDTDGDGVLDGDDATPLVPNTAPVINGEPDAQVSQDSNYLFMPDVSYEGDLNTITLSITNKPNWADFNLQTGELSGLPSNADVGVFNEVTINATNGHHTVSTEMFSIEVVNINDAPSLIKPVADIKSKVGKSFSLNVSTHFRDIDLTDTLTFTGSNLPSGLTLTESGVLGGKFESAFKDSVTVTATDDSGASVSTRFNAKISKKSSGGSSSLFVLVIMGLMAMIRKRNTKAR
jgi:hypothetical protein